MFGWLRNLVSRAGAASGDDARTVVLAPDDSAPDGDVAPHPAARRTAPPAKRGRGRPPGAKNRPKSHFESGGAADLALVEAFRWYRRHDPDFAKELMTRLVDAQAEAMRPPPSSLKQLAQMKTEFERLTGKPMTFGDADPLVSLGEEAIRAFTVWLQQQGAWPKPVAPPKPLAPSEPTSPASVFGTGGPTPPMFPSP